MPGAHECPKEASDPETEAAGGCEPPCGSWKSNLGSPEVQQVLLTAEQSPQPY